MTHRVELRVRYGETDQMGVVYHAEYLEYCEMGRTELIRSLGLPYSEMEKRGVMLAVTDASMRYHAGARYDDLLVVETQVTDVRSRSVTFDYVIRRVDNGARLVSAQTRLMAIDRNARPTAIPPDMRQLLTSVLAPGA